MSPSPPILSVHKHLAFALSFSFRLPWISPHARLGIEHAYRRGPMQMQLLVSQSHLPHRVVWLDQRYASARSRSRCGLLRPSLLPWMSPLSLAHELWRVMV